MDKKQEYYNSSVGYVTIFAEVVDQPDFVVVEENGGYGELSVIRKKDLVKKEDSYEYKERERRKKELEAIASEAEKRLDEIAEQLVDKSLKSLSTRIRLNAMFGKAENASFALTIVAELEKMIKEKPKETLKEAIKKKADPFA